jgi:hypothetical protein
MTHLIAFVAWLGFVVIEVADAIDAPVITPAGYRLGNWLSNLEGAA